MNIDPQIKLLAEELDLGQHYDEYVVAASPLGSPRLNIGIFGNSERAKNMLVNAIASTTLPTDIAGAHSLSTNTTYDIEDIDARLTIVRGSVDSESEPAVAAAFIAHADVAFVVTSATEALSRSETNILATLSQAAIPTLVVVADIEMVEEPARSEVIAYIDNVVKRFPTAGLAQICETFDDGNFKALASSLGEMRNPDTRNFLRQALQAGVIVKLFEKVNILEEQAQESIARVETITADKVSALESSSTEWMKLENTIREAVDKIRCDIQQRLAQRQESIARDLAVDIRTYNGDLRKFWELSLPNHLEKILANDNIRFTSLINKQFADIVKNVSDTMTRKYHISLALAPTTEGSESVDVVTDIADSNGLMDTNKAKIGVRMGSGGAVLATILIAGSAPIAGLAMAVGLLANAAGEIFLNRKADESRKIMIDKLPQLLAPTFASLAEQYETELSKFTDRLLNILNDKRAEYISQRKKEIESEHAAGIYNLRLDRLEGLAKRIDQLAQIIMS